MSGEYPVFFGHGLLAAGFFHPEARHRFVVSDENVARLGSKGFVQIGEVR